MIPLLALWASAWALPSTCSVGNTSADLLAAVARGEEAFGTMNAADLQKAADDALLLLPCLDEPLTKADAAALFRLQGMKAFVDKDRAAALSWFDAAKALLPSYVIPASLVSESHPLRGLYDSAEGGEPLGTAPVPSPSAGAVTVSGGRSESAPTNRPWVLQQLDPAGRVLLTALVAPGGEPPALVEVKGGGTSDPGGGWQAPPSKPSRVALLVRAGPVLQNASASGRLLVGLGPAATVRVGGPLLLDLGVGVGVTPVAVEGKRGVQPSLRVGARAELGSGDARGHLGLAALAALGREGLGPGAGGFGGARFTLADGLLLDADALVGWTRNSGGGSRSGGLWSALTVGLGVEL